MSDTEEHGQSAEGLSFIEDLQRKKEEHLKEEMEEYREMRAEEKQKEADEILALKRKREERAKERIEEEKRMAEQRKEEEVKRKAEEEERKKRKAEEEAKRKAEKERRRKEAEARAGPKTPNFTIVKKERTGGQQDDDDDKPPQKSKEELEKEKRAILAQRIEPIAVDGLDVAKLKEYAQTLHDKMRTLVANKYDLEERFKRQQYDMTELRERARQMSKVKKRGVATVQVDESFDPNADRFTNAPPKVLVASKFEINLDRRTWGEKLTCYSAKPKVLVASKFERNLDRRTWGEKLTCYADKPKILLCSKYERHTDNRSFGQRFQMYQQLEIGEMSPEIIRRRKSTPASPPGEEI